MSETIHIRNVDTELLNKQRQVLDDITLRFELSDGGLYLCLDQTEIDSLRGLCNMLDGWYDEYHPPENDKETEESE